MIKMSYSYKCYSETKEVMKKYVNAAEGRIIYGMGKTTFMNFAREAGAVYKIGATALVNTEIFESFIEQFREEPVPLQKHVYNKIKEERKNKNQ